HLASPSVPPSSASSSSSSPPAEAHHSPQSLSPTGHLVVAVCLGCIGTVAFLTNFLVLTLFCRYRALRTPMNLLLVSISFSDLLVSVLGTPFSFAASVHGRWLIGRAGCVWYGFVNACLGIVSLISLAVLSYERYNTIMATTMADGTDFRAVLGGIGFSWLYAVRYGPEGPGTTCSVDWKTQTVNNVSYIVCLFVFCLILPFCVILYSYGKLLRAIRQVSRMSSIVPRRREQRVLLMVVTMVVCYLVCWLPYGVAALLSAFGPRDLLTPTASITPSLLAKCSTAINPFIYVFMNKQVGLTLFFYGQDFAIRVLLGFLVLRNVTCRGFQGHKSADSLSCKWRNKHIFLLHFCRIVQLKPRRSLYMFKLAVMVYLKV
uniref:Teleost multiple tissue opsin b n=1 Tax=Neogobius melanostomus TaxID=47308 RepID=A0A8C6UQY1_9GOBI